MVGCLKNPHVEVDAISIWLAPTRLKFLSPSIIPDFLLAFSLSELQHELSTLGADDCAGLQRRGQVIPSSAMKSKSDDRCSKNFNLLLSVRVSNELGAGHPKAAKFSVLVTVSTSAAIGLIFAAIVLILRVHLSHLFTEVPEVQKETAKLAYLLVPTILLNSIQPVLSGALILNELRYFSVLL